MVVAGHSELSGKTKTRADLAQAVYERIGLSRVESAGLVEDVTDEMIEVLARGEDMKITGFGSSSCRTGPSGPPATPGPGRRRR